MNDPHDINNYNLYTENKWYLQLPLSQMPKSFTNEDLILGIKGFTLPEMSIGTNQIGLMGAKIPLPNTVREEMKVLTVKYNLASNWNQYIKLYKWFSLIAKENGTSSVLKNDNYLISPTLFILSEYKNPLVKINFTGAWINKIASLDLKFEDAEIVVPSFSMQYAYYEFENIEQV